MRCSGGCGEASAEPGPGAPVIPASDRAAGVLPGADCRRVTILFADVSGFIALSEKLDPKALRDLITADFDRLIRA